MTILTQHPLGIMPHALQRIPNERAEKTFLISSLISAASLLAAKATDIKDREAEKAGQIVAQPFNFHAKNHHFNIYQEALLAETTIFAVAGSLLVGTGFKIMATG